jgi:hypothetical protein
MALGGKKVGVVNSKQQAKYLGFSINFKMLQKLQVIFNCWKDSSCKLGHCCFCVVHSRLCEHMFIILKENQNFGLQFHLVMQIKL